MSGRKPIPWLDTVVLSEAVLQARGIRASTHTPNATAYRFYADGTESASVQLSPTPNAPYAEHAERRTVIQLRQRLQETGGKSGATTDDWKLQYSTNGGGSWADVTTGTSFVRAYDSASLTEGEATTNRIGAGTGSYVAGKVSEDGEVNDLQLTASNYTEIVFSLELVQANFAEGATAITFRVLYNGATFNHTFTPLLNVYKGFPYVAAIGASAAAQGDLTVVPPTHIANDVLVFKAESSNEAMATPSGWTEFPDSPQGAAGTGANPSRLAAFWLRAVDGSTASPVITDPGDHCIGVITAIRGCATTGDPFDVTAGNNTGTSESTAVSIPGDTTTGVNRLILAICADGQDLTNNRISGWANGDLADVEEIIDAGTAGANGGGIGVAIGRKAAAGAYGATTATLAGAAAQGRMSIAFKPPTVVNFEASFAGAVPLQSVSASLTTEAPEFNAFFAGSIPMQAASASLSVTAPQFAASFAGAVPLQALAAAMATDSPIFLAEFAGAVPLQSLSASLTAIGPIIVGLNAYVINRRGFIAVPEV